LVRDVENSLRVRGHKIEFRDRIGDAHSILIQPEDGIRLGASDPRSESKASGY
jgi:gamma-glutamyltranspeptidase